MEGARVTGFRLDRRGGGGLPSVTRVVTDAGEVLADLVDVLGEESVEVEAEWRHRPTEPFDLRTGQCLDNPGIRVPTYEVRIERGRVLVHREPRPGEHDGA